MLIVFIVLSFVLVLLLKNIKMESRNEVGREEYLEQFSLVMEVMVQLGGEVDQQKMEEALRLADEYGFTEEYCEDWRNKSFAVREDFAEDELHMIQLNSLSWDLYLKYYEGEELELEKVVSDRNLSSRLRVMLPAMGVNRDKSFCEYVDEFEIRSERDVDQYLNLFESDFDFEKRNFAVFLVQNCLGDLKLLTKILSNQNVRINFNGLEAEAYKLYESIFSTFDPLGLKAEKGNISMLKTIAEGFTADLKPGKYLSKNFLNSVVRHGVGVERLDNEWQELKYNHMISAVLMRNPGQIGSRYAEWMEGSRYSDLHYDRVLQSHPYNFAFDIFEATKGDFDLNNRAFEIFSNNFPEGIGGNRNNNESMYLSHSVFDFLKAWKFLAVKYGKKVVTDISEIETDDYEYEDPFDPQLGKLESYYQKAIGLEPKDAIFDFQTHWIPMEGERGGEIEYRNFQNLLEQGLKEKELILPFAAMVGNHDVLRKSEIFDFLGKVVEQDPDGLVLGDFFHFYDTNRGFRKIFQELIVSDEKFLIYVCNSLKTNLYGFTGQFAGHLLGEIVVGGLKWDAMEIVFDQLLDEVGLYSEEIALVVYTMLSYMPKVNEKVMAKILEVVLSRRCLWQLEQQRKMLGLKGDFEGSGFEFTGMYGYPAVLKIFGMKMAIEVGKGMVKENRGCSEQGYELLKDLDYESKSGLSTDEKLKMISESTFSPMRIYNGARKIIKNGVIAEIRPHNRKKEPGYWNFDLKICGVGKKGPEVCDVVRMKFEEGKVFFRDNSDVRFEDDVVQKLTTIGVDFAYDALVRQQEDAAEKESKKALLQEITVKEPEPKDADNVSVVANATESRVSEVLKFLEVKKEDPSTIDFRSKIEGEIEERRERTQNLFDDNLFNLEYLAVGGDLEDVEEDLIVFEKIVDGRVPSYRQLSQAEIIEIFESENPVELVANLFIPTVPHFSKKSGVERRAPGSIKGIEHVWGVIQRQQTEDDQLAFEAHKQWDLPHASEPKVREGASLRIKTDLKAEGAETLADVVAEVRGMMRLNGKLYRWKLGDRMLSYRDAWFETKKRELEEEVKNFDVEIESLRSMNSVGFAKWRAMKLKSGDWRISDSEREELEFLEEAMLVIGDFESHGDYQKEIDAVREEYDLKMEEVRDEFQEVQKELDGEGGLYEEFYLPLYNEKVKPLEVKLKAMEADLEVFEQVETMKNEAVRELEEKKVDFEIQRKAAIEEEEELFGKARLCKRTIVRGNSNDEPTAREWIEIYLPWEANMSFVNPQMRSLAGLFESGDFEA